MYGRKPLKIGSKYWIEVVYSHSIVPRIAIMIITSFHACSELIFHSIRQNNSFKRAFLKFSLYPNVGNIKVEMMQKWTLVTARPPLILGEKKSQKEERPAGQATKNRPLPLSSMSGSATTCKLLIDSASPLVSWSYKTTGDQSPSCEIVILRQFEWEYLRPLF